MRWVTAVWMLVAVSAAVSGQETKQKETTKQPESFWFEGLWTGYDGEWIHVERQVMALAEATPAEKYTWRPEPGVRSFSEVYMHIAVANLGLLSMTGPKSGKEITQNTERQVTSKAEVMDWLRTSFQAVREARAKVKHEEYGRKVKVGSYDGTVDGMYMRIIVHANEHMGQLIAYARMAGIVPPWSN